MNYFVRTGRSCDYIPVADTEAGTIVVQGSLVGVVQHFIAANELGSVELEGIYNIEKSSSSTTFSVGDIVYFDDSKAVAEGGDGTFGICTKASANGDVYVEAKLIQNAAGSSAGGSSSEV